MSTNQSLLPTRRPDAYLPTGPVSPFTWSILQRPVIAALSAQFEAAGLPVPDANSLVHRAAGQAVLDAEALGQLDATLAANVTGTTPSLVKQLLGGSQERWQTTWMRPALEQAPGQLAAIERWAKRTQSTSWRQATVLQVMEEIEPQAEAALAAQESLRTALLLCSASVEMWAQQRPVAPAELLAGLADEGADYDYALWQLGEAVSQSQDWRSAAPSDGLESLSDNLRQAVERFLNDYRQWATQPLEAASPRWGEAPEALLAAAAARPTIGSRPNNPDLARRQRTEAGTALGKHLGPLSRRPFLAVFEQMQQLAQLLVESRRAFITVMATARHWALAAAREAMADGRLTSQDDVFLLELEELKQIMTGEWVSPERVLALVERRRAEQAVAAPAR